MEVFHVHEAELCHFKDPIVDMALQILQIKGKLHSMCPCLNIGCAHNIQLLAESSLRKKIMDYFRNRSKITNETEGQILGRPEIRMSFDSFSWLIKPSIELYSNTKGGELAFVTFV